MATALFSPPPPLFSPRTLTPKLSCAQIDAATTSPQETETPTAERSKKKIFVAGSGGRTGKKIVGQLLSKGFAVRAGALNLDKARSNFPNDPNVDIVRADVTEGPEKLSQAIGDAEAGVCATGFRYSWDVFAPWKDTLYEAPYLGIR